MSHIQIRLISSTATCCILQQQMQHNKIITAKKTLETAILHVVGCYNQYTAMEHS